jgi:hypothetical protein
MYVQNKRREMILFWAHFLSLRSAQRTLRAGNRAFRSNSSASPMAKPVVFPLQSLARSSSEKPAGFFAEGAGKGLA